MRSRNIKPGFFLNSELADVDFATRLLFIGLWCYSDREGRFEWKPRQIRAAIFPYDNVDIDALLCNLMSLHLIACHDMVGHIPCFKKHQHPHPHEPKSLLPELPNDFNVIACHTNVIACQEDIRIKDIRIKDTKPLPEYSDEFISFWTAYPKKEGKDAAHKAWKKIKSPAGILQSILTAVEWQKLTEKWTKENGQFIPQPSTYLNAGGWKDEKPIQTQSPSADAPTTKTNPRFLELFAKLKQGECTDGN